MQALIIAAGFGSRLSELSNSKPLTPICNVAMIEISIRQAKASGISSFVVVTGHQAAQLEAELGRIGAEQQVSINSVRLTDWSRPNGYSVIAGARMIDGPFLLMMADHIFSRAILDQLIAADRRGFSAILAVDRRVDNSLIDPDDATWVKTRSDGGIVAIGKTISPFDAADCGAFVADACLPDAIERAIAMGKPGSLSDGMQLLADDGQAGTLDIGDAWWIDVDDPHFHQLAQRQAPLHIGFLEPSPMAAQSQMDGD